jgi:hypothetical protein
MGLKDATSDAAVKILGGLATKGIDEVKDEKVKEYLTDVWGDLEKELPDLAKTLVGSGEVVLSGKHAEMSKDILLKMKEDIFAFKAREIDQIELEDLVQRRKAALFALYQAEKKSSARPSIQKILDAGERIATILITKGIPFLLALL